MYYFKIKSISLGVPLFSRQCRGTTTSIEIESHGRVFLAFAAAVVAFAAVVVVVVGRGPFNQLSNENVKISKVKKAK